MSSSLQISGATGADAKHINGTYKLTGGVTHDLSAYRNSEDGYWWWEYYSPAKQWQMKSTVQRGANCYIACCTVSSKCLPQHCPQHHWGVIRGLSPSPTALTITAVGEEQNICIAGITSFKFLTTEVDANLPVR